MIPEKPYALSCDKNSEPILQVLKKYLPKRGTLLEVGAGTGQHAIHMAPYFPEIHWTLSDQQERHAGIQMWLSEFPRVNLAGPVLYEIGKTEVPKGNFDIVFTANTLHILPWELDLKFFDDLKEILPSKGLFIAYGAFNYKGDYTSESNKTFDQWLQNRDPKSAIRDFEKVNQELENRGFNLLADEEMPANNRTLIFQKN